MKDPTRSRINTALAKTMAYRACGKHEMADTWAARLILELDAANVLRTEAAEDARRFHPGDTLR